MSAKPAFDPATEFEALSLELRGAIRSWELDPDAWSPERDRALVQRAFRLQYESNPPYRAYCERRSVDPSSVSGWRAIPPVPTAAFREIDLALQGVRAPEAVFRTSGTTGGRSRRGRHPILDLSLYRASLEAVFRWHVLDGGSHIPILSLVAPFDETADSSLAWMCDALIARFGGGTSEWAADGEGFKWERADAFLDRACTDGVAICVLATTLAAGAWVGRLQKVGRRRVLPEGSRLMDTGGAKGHRGLDRSSVVAGLQEYLGIAPQLVINEFGMTELLSQRYSRSLSSGDPGQLPPSGSGPSRWLHGPPWLRSRALDPETLEELSEGQTGVLSHFDLANLGSVCAIVTEDMGRVSGGSVEWIGRTPGAPPRGCSLAAAELLAAGGKEDGLPGVAGA